MMAQIALNNVDVAVENFKKALELEPNDGKIKEELAAANKKERLKKLKSEHRKVQLGNITVDMGLISTNYRYVNFMFLMWLCGQHTYYWHIADSVWITLIDLKSLNFDRL
ncbi:uncharacterized protein A4U43_C03F18090 [Asparagus officinalis]|uniref:Uncharacterized protein n=1 Tax=Asparagus officinalis TaxID=4686 RepID=A0A5P1FBL1_ASPOF|nr:uncharacterized protein A4U43_C03F18090 [Asparagus officinalis]